MAYLLALAIGVIAGLRSMTAPAAVAWAVTLRAVDLPELSQSYLSFLQSPITAWIFTLLAAGELVADKLPFTPSRLSPTGLGGRIIMGGLCGAALCLATASSALIGVCLGILGAVLGAYAGYSYRTKWVRPFELPDLPVAIVEDAIAVFGAWLIVMHV